MYTDEGMPRYNYASQKGKLHLKLIIDLPDTISKAGKDILKKIFALSKN